MQIKAPALHWQVAFIRRMAISLAIGIGAAEAIFLLLSPFGLGVPVYILVIAGLPSLLYSILGIILSRRNLPTLACSLVLVGISITSTLTSAFVDGMYQALTCTYILIILLAAFLLGRRAAIIISGSAMLLQAGVYLMLTAGLIPAEWRWMPSTGQLAVCMISLIAFIFTMTATLSTTYARMLEQALAIASTRVTRLEGNLLERLVELEALVQENGRLYKSAQQELYERTLAEKRLERQYAEVERARSEIRAVLDAANDGMAFIGVDRRVLSINKRFSELFDLDPVMVIGYTADQLMPLTGRIVGDLNKFQEQLAQRRSESKDHFMLSINQSWPVHRELDIYSTAVNSSDGELIGHLYTIRDVTRERELDRMKNEFISTVSHELRTPLTSIRGALGLMLGGVTGELPAQAKRMLEIAVKNSVRLIMLINDILDMEKIASGKMVFDLVPLAVMPLVDQAREANQAYADLYNVRLSIVETLPDAMIDGDSARMMQVLANLLSNAVKFSPSGSTVELAVTRQDSFIRIAVRDHGSGIPEEFRNRIFQKFAQADSSDTRRKGGTGLGLSISKAIVERHGGKIGFDTVPNAGTTFYVDLPEKQVACGAPPPTTVSVSPAMSGF